MSDFWRGFFFGIWALFMIALIFGKPFQIIESKYIIIKESQVVRQYE